MQRPVPVRQRTDVQALLWVQAITAADCLRRAARLDPDVADCHYNLALALERLGRDGAAMRELRRAISIDADRAAARERLGDLLVKHGRRDRAAGCYRRVASLQPDGLLGRISHASHAATDARIAAHPRHAAFRRHYEPWLGELVQLLEPGEAPAL